MKSKLLSTGVLSRFVVLMFVTTALLVIFRADILPQLSSPPGDYEVRQGDILLGDRKYAEALDRFDAALEEQPDHRGALMGRGIVFLKTEQWDDAEAEFTYLIDYLRRTLEHDDTTGRGALAAAHANRGILYDLTDRHEQALGDYVEALRIDEGAVDGPSLFDKILYNTPRPSTVRDRARYIYEQLQLPESQRVMRMPERDAQERMYKP